MKKITKRSILLCVLIAVLVLAAIALINLYPLISMSPAETGRIGETEIISVKNSLSSMFFIESDGGYIVIDAGTKKDGVDKALGELSIDPYGICCLPIRTMTMAGVCCCLKSFRQGVLAPKWGKIP